MKPPLSGCVDEEEARRKEVDLSLDTLVPETSTHLHHHIKK